MTTSLQVSKTTTKESYLKNDFIPHVYFSSWLIEWMKLIDVSLIEIEFNENSEWNMI